MNARGTLSTRTLGVVLLGLLLVALASLPAAAQRFVMGENQLAGVRLSESPTTLLRSPTYGPPDAVIASGGVFNARRPSLLETAGGGTPAWAQAVWIEGLTADQVVWLYDRPPVAVAFVINGQGDEAEITDIVVSLWKKVEPSNWAQTKKGIKLGDTFAKVMLKYGFPDALTIFQGAAPSPAAVAGPGALPAPGGAGTSMPTLQGVRFRFGGRDQPTQSAAPAPTAPAGTGAGPLPPATPAAPASQEWGGNFTGVLMGQQVSLSRHMVMGYPRQGIDFYLYDMQVVRVHAYTVSAAVGQAQPAGVPGVRAAAPTTPTAPSASAIMPGGTSIFRGRIGFSRRD